MLAGLTNSQLSKTCWIQKVGWSWLKHTHLNRKMDSKISGQVRGGLAWPQEGPYHDDLAKPHYGGRKTKALHFWGIMFTIATQMQQQVSSGLETYIEVMDLDARLTKDKRYQSGACLFLYYQLLRDPASFCIPEVVAALNLYAQVLATPKTVISCLPQIREPHILGNCRWACHYTLFHKQRKIHLGWSERRKSCYWPIPLWGLPMCCRFRPLFMSKSPFFGQLPMAKLYACKRKRKKTF